MADFHTRFAALLARVYGAILGGLDQIPATQLSDADADRLLAVIGSWNMSSRAFTHLLEHPELLRIVAGQAGQVSLMEWTVMSKHVLAAMATMPADGGRFSIRVLVDRLRGDESAAAASLLIRILEFIDSNDSECFICFDRDLPSMKVLGCGHAICATCLGDLPERICPFCRREIAEVFDHDAAASASASGAASADAGPARKTLTLVPADETHQFVTTLVTRALCGTGRLTPQTRELIELVAQIFPEILDGCLGAPHIPSIEITCFSLGQLHKVSPGMAAPLLLRKLKRPSHLRRFLAVLNDQDPDADAKIAFKISRPLRRVIVACLLQMDLPQALQEIKAHRKFWATVFKILHVSKDYADDAIMQLMAFVARHNRLGDAGVIGDFNEATNAQISVLLREIIDDRGLVMTDRQMIRIEASIATLDRALAVHDIDACQMAFDLCPPMLFRNARRFVQLVDAVGSLADVADWLSTALLRLRTEQLIELACLFEQYPEIAGAERSFRTRYGTAHQTTDLVAPISQAVVDGVLQLLRRSILSQLARPLSVGDGVEIPTLMIGDDACHTLVNKGKYPIVPDWALGTVRSYGDVVTLQDDGMLMLFIHWGNTSDGTCVDLDLSIIFYDDDGEMVGYCDYSDLEQFGGAVQHSGDYIDAPLPSGATEYVTIDVAGVLADSPDVAYAVVVSFSYNDVSYDDMERALVGVAHLPSAEADRLGQGPEGSTVLGVAGLGGKAKMNIAAIFDFQSRGVMFVNSNIPSRLSGTHDVQNRSRIISMIAKCFMEMQKPASYLDIGRYLVFDSTRHIVCGDRFFSLRAGEDRDALLTRVIGGVADALPAADGDAAAAAADADPLRALVAGAPVLFIGQYPPSWLPDGSIVVAKNVPLNMKDTWTHVADPFALFTLLQ
jgi:Zinc finger, C3HC4 type (RING finger)